MRLVSRLSPRDYLQHMRQKAHFRLDIRSEGFSGFVVGKFFLLKYHAFNGDEKQRLYKEEARHPRCSYNAFGFVRSGDYGSEILCLYSAGFLDPLSVVFILLVGVVASLYGGFLFEEPLIAIFTAIFISVFLVAFSVIVDSRACCAERGRRRILKVLEDPSERYQSS